MNAALQQAPAIPAKAVEAKWKLWVPLALFSALWLDLIRLLSTQWETREQYAYGWFVPFFALALLWKRWADRPGVAETTDRNAEDRGQRAVVSGHSAGQAGRSSVVGGLVVVCLVALLPLRVIFEINTDWPLISWSYSLIVVGTTLYAFHLSGGWPWVKHFAFPVAFILVAVTWPYRIEHGLTQSLMRIVAGITVEILGWFDIPALQHGNLIELSNGTLGIDEACSGIRSFQSSLMAALLMGELYRLRAAGRTMLVICGLALGFLFNLVRTTTLGWATSVHGLQALKAWHDPAGMSITVACFFCLWGLAGLAKRTVKKKSGTLQAQAEESRARLGRGPSLLPTLKASRSGVYLSLVGLWSVLIIGANEIWYRVHETKGEGDFRWSVALPANNPSFRTIDLSERTRATLACDSFQTGSWTNADGSQWSLFFFRWNPTSIEKVFSARVHRPEECLPASGLRQRSDLGIRNFAVDRLQLPFRQYVYTGEGKTLYVFFCQWEDGKEKQTGMWGMLAGTHLDRVRSVLVGRRKVGQQTLEIIITGASSQTAAAHALEKALPGLTHSAATKRPAPGPKWKY